MRRAAVILVLVGSLVFHVAGLCLAQDYPSRPIQIIVPFSAGGSLDLQCRVLAEKLRESLRQPVIVVNKPGGGQAVGASFVATSKPDGYILYASSGATFGFMHLLKPDFTWGLKDFVPIAATGAYASIFVVHKDVPVKTLRELIVYIQKNPGKLLFGSTGYGGINHLEFELFKMLVKGKLDIEHVPYQGVAPALTALLGNQVQFCNLPYSSLLKKHHPTSIRLLAVLSPQRIPFLPDIPAVGEEGYPEVGNSQSHLNFSAPAGTPASIIAKLEAAFEKAMQDKELRGKIEQLDTQPVFINSRDTHRMLEQQVLRWEEVIKKANIVAK
jgi:tripartite-type tricarboxylate transporter receptor subunit TctC